MRRHNVLEAIYLSIFSKSLYQDVAKNWNGGAFVSLLLLLSVCWLSTMYEAHSVVSKYMVDHAPDIIKQFPEVGIQNGEVSATGAQPVTVFEPLSNEPIITIDTTGKITSFSDTDAKMLLTKTDFMTNNGRKTEIHSLAEIDEFYVDQERLAGWADMFKNWFAIVAYPFGLLGSFVYRMVQVLIYAVIGIVFSKIAKSDLDYQALIRLATISILPVIILDFLVGLLEITIPFFSFLCFLFAMGYLFYGVYVNSGKMAQE